jgi:hypothetical protein
VTLVQAGLALAALAGDRQLVRLLSSSEDVNKLTLTVLPVLLPTFISECGSRSFFSSTCCALLCAWGCGLQKSVQACCR